MLYPQPDFDPQKREPLFRYEVDYTDKDPRSLAPHPLDMAADDGRDDDEPTDWVPAAAVIGITLSVAGLVGLAAWYGATAIGSGL